MKKTTIISVAIISILATVSCSEKPHEEGFDPGVPTTLSATLSPTADPSRTALGPKEGTAYPNLWAAGDKICVNGITSAALDAAEAGTATAKFTFEPGLSTPYYAAYPAAAASGYSAGSATLTVPASQAYVEGSYDPAAYVMAGKSSTPGVVTLTPRVSIIHLTLTGSASISKIKLTSNDAAVSGSFTTDFNSTFEPKAVSNVVEVNPASAVALPAEFFICVPAGLSGSFTADVFDDSASKGYMQINGEIPSGQALAAGQMYSSPAIAYVPSYDLHISAEGITSSTAVICWDDPTPGYIVGVYSDPGCTSLIDSYDIPANNSCWGNDGAEPDPNPLDPRFCISGLTGGTTYYVKVHDKVNEKDSNVLTVITSPFTVVEASSDPAAVGQVILAEDFSELRWDCDMIGSGAGWFPTAEAQAASFETLEIGSFQAAATSNEKQISAQTNPVAASRLAHWAQGANPHMYVHPGYIKLVGQKKVTHIVTPALDCIPAGKIATVEVEVTASAYYSETSSSFCTTHAIVAVQAGTLNDLVDETNTNSLDLESNIQEITLDEATAWKTYKVTLSNVVKGNRIAFGARSDISGNDARMNVSDIKVTLTALDNPVLTASLKSVSSSTAAFRWTYGGAASEDVVKPYTASLYSDEACTSLVVSHAFEANASCWYRKVDSVPTTPYTPCFSFGGLAPSTNYWFKVEDTENGAVSDVISVTTEAFEPVDATTVSGAAVGDVILAEDFSEIGWGPEEFAVAAGFIPDPKNLNAPSGVSPTGAFTDYENTGQRIFGTGVDLGTSRLSKGWGFFGNSAAYLRNAYLRVATTSGRTHIVTPKLAGIPAGKLATIEVTITAAKQESNTNDVAVFVSDQCEIYAETDPNSSDYRKYKINGSKTALPDNGTAFGITSVKPNWETKTVSVSNVDSGCQLIIGSYEDVSGKNRFNISDVKVTITELIDDPLFKIYDNATFQAFVDAVAAGNKDLEAKVTEDITLDASTVEAFSSIEDYAGTFNGNGKTIAGLTKPLFNDLKGTVSGLTLNSTLNITVDQLNLGILANVLSGTAIGCTSKGSVTFNVAGGVTGEHHIAGLIGQALEGSSITGCTNEASVTNETSNAGGNSYELMVGGVLGIFWGVNFTISDCENTGAVTNNGAWNIDVSVGGVIGQAGNSSSLSCNMTVSDCTNSGPVTNNGETNDATNSVGGVIGWIRFGTYTDNSNTGTVTNTGNAKQNRVGGLIGYLDKNATFDNNSNSGEVSNTGEASDINYVGGLLGRMQTGSTFKNNSNSGSVSNSGDATNYVYMGGIVGYLDKENKISDAGSSAQYKLTNSGDIENGGSAKNICIGGLFGRNSSGYFNMTGTSSKYSTNRGNITDNSGPAKSNGGDLSIGGIAGYTTTGIKTQYARNYGDIYVTGDKGNTSINVGGIGGWISNNGFNFNNCRNTGDVTVDATTTVSIWVAGIVGCPMNNSTEHYYWYMNATIDTHAANVGGENYTAGLMGVPQDYKDKSGKIANPDIFKMTGHKLAGTIWGSKTTTGLFCCTKTNAFTFNIRWGDSTHPCTIAPGTVRKDNTHDDTVNTLDDITLDNIAGGVGITADVLTNAKDEGYIVVAEW